jgi:predicted solute-binding protein
MLRIGCVKYLNARPLIHGWNGDVGFDHPSVLCQRLANGKLDVALVSSFEFLRNPIYRIVDDVSISSDGSVYSVVVAHRGDISKIEEIELDPAAETSVNLLRCLLAELELNPRLIRGVPGSAGCQSAGVGSPPQDGFAVANSPTAHRARLLIGDQAIFFRQKHANEFSFWDLGEQWRKLVGLPFVYALWLIRPEVADPMQLANRLRALRDENLANPNALIAEVVAGVADPVHREQFNHEFLSRYYRQHLRFSFGEREKRGLRIFGNLCAKHSLLSRRDLVFRVL